MKDVYDLTHFDAAWKTTFAAGDPYFNPRLSQQADDYRPDDEPVQWVVSGAPMFNVRRRSSASWWSSWIISAISSPRCRRSGGYARCFRSARITVLAGPASRGFISLEPSIDEFIPFSFFHRPIAVG